MIQCSHILLEVMLVTRTTVGVRQLKAGLSNYLRQVKAGSTVVITERGQPIGRIVPIETTVEERLRKLQQAGLVSWSGRKLEPVESAVHIGGDRTVAELLLEDRE